MKFQIDSMKNGHGVFTVRACSYVDAGRIAARRMHGRRMTGIRVTGDNEKSGMFNAYKPTRDGHSAVGENFHVRQL